MILDDVFSLVEHILLVVVERIVLNFPPFEFLPQVGHFILMVVGRLH